MCDSFSVRVFSRSSGRKLSTVLPPPGLSPMSQILCVTFNRAAKLVYLLLNTKVIWVYTTRSDLRRFALWYIYSFSGATGVFWLKCRFLYLRFGAKMTDASSKIDVHRLRVGGYTNKNISTLYITRSSIPCSRTVVVNVPVTRQRRHLERIQCV